MNKIFFWILYALQIIIAYSSFNGPTDAPTEGLIKFSLVYIIAWYLFKIPLITALVVNKATIGGAIILYLFMVTTVIFTKDAGIGWGEIIGLLLMLFLIPLIVFFLGYVRLKEHGIDILEDNKKSS
jgi:hypothetical protein